MEAADISYFESRHDAGMKENRGRREKEGGRREKRGRREREREREANDAGTKNMETGGERNRA